MTFTKYDERVLVEQKIQELKERMMVLNAAETSHENDIKFNNIVDQLTDLREALKSLKKLGA